MAALPRLLSRWSGAVLAVLLFVAAVRTLGAAAEALGPTLSGGLAAVIGTDASALGAGWLLTYLLANGSVVAGLGVTLVDSAVLEPIRGFLIVAGSRLGAAAFVVLVGVLEYLRSGRRLRLRRALGLGFLTFLVTHTVYLPATAVGYGLFRPLQRLLLGTLPGEIRVGALERTGEVALGLAERIGPLPVAGLGLLLAVASLRLFDGFLEGIDEERLRARCEAWLRGGWISFLLGLLITTITTSVAVSVGALVPLFNRRLLRARQLVPYLLGAGLGTMADTLLVALLLGSRSGLAMVLALVAAAAAVTLGAVARAAAYTSMVERVFDWVVDRPLHALAFGGLLLAAPTLLFLAS